MASETIKVSPELQVLISKGLFDRFPLSFSAYCFEQLHGWDVLFPAERNYYERFFSLIERSDPDEIDRLFQPMRDIEVKMGVNEKTWPRRQFTLDQVDFLNRNQFY